MVDLYALQRIAETNFADNVGMSQLSVDPATALHEFLAFVRYRIGL